ncbi:uncharacterized protein LOC135349879 [Halichondria panicea]|uniref:uncharacterized protein LOC135349879 n=1 Tax=Halichondria panicea TaxID=6063 RepID=UPI00312B9F3E
MDLSPSTQEKEQPQQVSSHSPSAQHTNKSPLIVSIPRSIREQHITDTTSTDTRLCGDTPLQLIVSIPYPIMRAQRNTRSNKLIVSIPYPPRETHTEHEQSKQSHSDINSPLARKRLHTRTRDKKCQPSSTLQGASPSDTPPAKRVHLDIPHQLAGSSRQYESDDTCIQQYESDNSLQSDDVHSETDEHSIAKKVTLATCSNQFLEFNEMYTELYEARSKWYDLGLALGLDTGTLDSIDIEHKKCKTCLREVLKQRDNATKLTRAEIDKALRQPSVELNTLADKIQESISTKKISTSSSQPSSDPTPKCVLRYISLLKDRYKQISTFPDDWPPPLKEKFTKLALIERSTQIRLTQAKHQPSIEYDYATGNVDNIVKRKKAITLEQIFEVLIDDNKIATPNRYIVVMDGAPGVGKTTLSRKICIDWAQGKLIKDHHIVILKPLRELRGHTAASLSDLLNADDLKQHEREEILDHIKSTYGSGVMFIFDGFDELSGKQRSDKNTIIWEIIRGNRLLNCSVLVTSRSYASGPLQELNRVNRHVEVLGFKKKDIEHCIKQNVTDKRKAKKLIQMLKERLDIVSLCYIPLNCRIVLYVYQQQDTLPDTLTQLYELFILYTVKHYKNKIFQEREHEIDNDQIEHANTIMKLPTQIIKCLDCLSETAFTGMTQDKLVFEYTEVTKERGALSLGLLNLIKCMGAHYYQFLHLTIQEFLAARHLALTKSNEDKLVFVTSKIDDARFRMTLLFLSGLTQLDFITIEQAFPAPKSIDTRVEHTYKTKTKSLQKQVRCRFLFLAHLQYESRQTTYNWLLPCLVTNSLNLSEHSLSQFDCLVLANFLALTPKDHVWDEINLSQCSLTDDRFKTIITKKHLQRDIPVLCLTKQLDVTSNKINAEDLHVMPLLSEESKVDSISIPHYESCTKLSGAIVKGLNKLVTFNFSQHSADHDQTVLSSREITVPTDSTICSGMLTTIFEVVRPKDLKRVSLDGPKAFEDCPDCSGSGNEAWKSVCNVIQNSKHIQHIQIHKSQFHLHNISSLLIHLPNKRNLCTIYLHGNKISHNGLIHLRNNLPVNVRAHISISDKVKLAMSVHKDKLVHVDIESPDEYIQDDDSEDLFVPFMPLLEGDLPLELHGVTVTTKSFVSKTLLRSIGNSKAVTSLTLANLSNENFTKCSREFQDMLKKTIILQTLELDSCKLNDISIKQLECGLLLNETVALKIEYSWQNSWLKALLTVRSQNLRELDFKKGPALSEERTRQLSEIVTTCKQLRVLKVNLSYNLETFFHALSDNHSLRELSIETTRKMATLLFRTLPSTSVTTLDVSQTLYSGGFGNEGSLAFKKYIHGNKMLTVLRANWCGLTDEALKGIIFTKESPLRELSLSENYEVKQGWTEFFNGLCSSCITTLDVKNNSLNGEECCTALKCLLINNKTLTVLKIGTYQNNDDVVCCIADALSQNCSLMELTISSYTLSILGWTKLFESLHENTTLVTLNCSRAKLQELEQNNEVAKSVWELLIHNQSLQNLNIADELIEGHLKEFAMAYIQRKTVLNLTVGKLEDELVKEIERLETDKYNIKNRMIESIPL